MPDLHLMHALRGKRYTNRVADSIRKQRADTNRALDTAGLKRTGLRHAEVQRIIRPLSEQPISLNHEEDIRVLHRDHDVFEAVLRAYLDVSHRAFEERLRLRKAVLIHDILLERTRVDADPDRNSRFLRGKQHLLLPLLLPDVTRVDANLGDARFNGTQGVLIVEVNVRNDRHRRSLNDVADCLDVLRTWDGDAHDVGAGIGQAANFSECSLDVVRLRDGHRLDGDRGAAAHLDGSNVNGARLPARALHIESVLEVLNQAALVRSDILKAPVVVGPAK